MSIPSSAYKFLQHRRTQALLVFLAALLVYALTLFPPGVGGKINCGDSAKFQFIGSIFGISHPPGSPLYVMLSGLWSLLPLPGELAARINLLSAVFASGALVFVWLMVGKLGGSVLDALAAVLVLAFSPAFWVFATEAEVYAANSFFIAFLLHRALLWRERRRPRDLALLAGVFTLAMANHYLAMTLLPALLLCLTPEDRHSAPSLKSLGVALLAVALCALPFLYVPLRQPSATYTELTGPNSWASYLRYFTASQYSGNLSRNPLEALVRIWRISESTLLQQTGLLPLLFVVPGLLAVWLRRGAREAWLMVLAGLVPLCLACAYSIPDGDGYYIPFVLVVAVLAGVGLGQVMTWLAGLMRAHRPGRAERTLPVAVALLVLAVLALRIPQTHASLRANLYEIGERDRLAKYDLRCILDQLQPGTFVALHWGDYGSRQIANYYRATHPLARDGGVGLEYLFEPNPEFTWARRATSPDLSATPRAVTFDEPNAQRLAQAGYRMREELLDVSACRPKAARVRVFFGERPGQ